MFKKIAKCIALITLFSAATAQALPIVQADAFSSGDNKAALETSTGLVWMDFGVNSHQTHTEIKNSLSTVYNGWRLPTLEEVDHLWTGLLGDLPEWQRFNPGFGILRVNAHDDYFNNIATVFGANIIHQSDFRDLDEFGNIAVWSASGLFAPFSDGLGSAGFVQLAIADDDIHPNISVFLAAEGYDISDWYGALLVKEANVSVTEPSSILLSLMALMAILFRRQLRC